MINKLFLAICRPSLLFLLALICFITYGQSNQLQITGKIIDNYDEPVEVACLYIVDVNNEFVASCLSDSSGSFSLSYPSITKGTFYVTHLSYEDYSSSIDELSKNPISIVLKKDVIALGSVSVTAPSSFTTNSDGNIVAKINSIPGYENMSTSKILNRLPGISVNNNGKITLFGSNATIYIDGIKQNINTNALESYLKSLPASILSEIELLAIPPAKYDSDVSSVINLKLNKKMPEGSIFEIGVFTGIQRHYTHDSGFDMLYMIKKDNTLFNSTVRYDNKLLFYSGLDSTSYGQNSNSPILNNYKDLGLENSITSNSNLTINMNKGNKLDMNLFLYYGIPDHDYSYKITQFDISSNSNSASRYKQGIKGRDDMYAATVKYTSPSDKDFNMSIYYTGLWGGIRSYNNYYEYESQYNWEKIIESEIAMEGHMHTIALDFSNKFLKSAKIEYGSKFNINLIEDITDYKSLMENTIDKSKFYGREFIASAYAKVNYKMNDYLSFNGSLRGEYTNYKLDYKLTDYKRTNNYVNLFPKLMVILRSTPYTGVFSYHSIIKRQNYLDLIPGERYINQYYTERGNPDLDPMIYLIYTIKNILLKGAVNIRFQYQMIKDYYYGVLIEDNLKIYMTPLNFTDLNKFYIRLDVPVKLFNEKLYANFNFRTYWTEYKNLHEDFIVPTNRKKEYFNFDTKLNMQYEITERLTFDCLFSLVSKKENLTYDQNMLWYADAGASYSFLKKKQLVFSIDVNNIFNTKDIASDNYFGDNYRYINRFSNGSIVKFSIKYKFNKGRNISDKYRDLIPDTERMTRK